MARCLHPVLCRVIVASLREIQADTLAEIEILRVTSFQDGRSLADDSIDRAFGTGLKLLGAAFIGGGLLITLHAWLTRRRVA